MVKLTRSKTVSDKKSKSPQTKGERASVVPKKVTKKDKKILLKKEEKSTPLKSFIHIKTEILPPKNHKVTILDKTKKTNVENISVHDIPEIKPIIRPHTLPAICSPYRFPLLPEKHIGTVSKIAGIFLVFSGVFLSFVNMYAKGAEYVHLPVLGALASVISSQETASQEMNTVESVSNSLTDVVSTDTKPRSRIVIDGTTPFSGTVPVMITVPSALEVKLMLLRKRDGNLTILGPAQKIDTTTWKYLWQTHSYDDGEYAIKVFIKNSFGTYDDKSDSTFIIQNHVSTASTSPSVNTTTEAPLSADTAESTSTDQIVTEVPRDPQRVSLTQNATFLSKDSLRFVVSTLNATEVKLYARNVKTLTLHYVGLAKRSNGETWYVDWNTANIPNGTYAVRAKAKVNDSIIESSQTEVLVVYGIEKSTVDNTATSTQGTEATESRPFVRVLLPEDTQGKEYLEIKIEASQSTWVEVYAQSKNSLTPRFLGLAKEISPSVWKYTWETRQSPNAEYLVYARAKSLYGFTDSERVKVVVKNELVQVYTEAEEKALDTYKEAESVLKQKVEDIDFENQALASGTEEVKSETTLENQVYVQPITTFLKEIEVDAEGKDEVELLLKEFREALQEKLLLLSRAERVGDTEAYRTVLEDIQKLKEETVNRIPEGIDNSDVVLRIEGYIYQIVSVLQELTIGNERILKERIGSSITTDSDSDDISDYDEIHLYKTDPFVADTDGDSFVDGVEITGGYNPLDSNEEALLIYESPKEAGIVREDLLVVDSITAFSADADTDATGVAQKAVISGKALPHSFVNIYIFSTPIVVTVRTDAEGNWNYIFDKELEDGNHEVYIGITDNAGRVVAKSNPFSFVKTAEAFTETSPVQTPAQIENSEPSLIGKNIIFLLGSVLVVMLGLILIMLGIHVTGRKMNAPVITTP
jgi:hypothetical protein